MLHVEEWGRGVRVRGLQGMGRVWLGVEGEGEGEGEGFTFIKSLLENVTLYGNLAQISSPVLASSLVLECNCVF
jgi:hypothetical protein